MSGDLSTRFFWSDWMSDPALRACGYAARGLWMDLLGIAAAANPVGYVAVNGRALDTKAIARMTGGEVSEVVTLLGELEANGVFSRDRKGTIYSRRMIRDAKKAEISKKNGKKGGNPSLRKERQISNWDNPQDIQPPGIPFPIPDSNREENSEPPSQFDLLSEPVAPPPTSPPPRRTGTYAFQSGTIRLNERDHAQWSKAFSNLDLEAELLALEDWAEKQGKNWFHAVRGALAKRNREMSVRMEAARNGAVPAVVNGPPGQQPGGTISFENRRPSLDMKPETFTPTRWQGMLQLCRDRSVWIRSLGPAPFEDGCVVPPDLLREGDKWLGESLVDTI